MLSREESSREDAIVTLNKFQLEMVNRHLVMAGDDDYTIEKLLQPSRITIKYLNIIEKQGLISDNLVDINMEPFEVKLGYREVDFFNQLNVNFQEFQKNIAPEEEQKEEIDPETNLEKALEQEKKK